MDIVSWREGSYKPSLLLPLTGESLCSRKRQVQEKPLSPGQQLPQTLRTPFTRADVNTSTGEEARQQESSGQVPVPAAWGPRGHLQRLDYSGAARLSSFSGPHSFECRENGTKKPKLKKDWQLANVALVSSKFGLEKTTWNVHTGCETESRFSSVKRFL